MTTARNDKYGRNDHRVYVHVNNKMLGNTEYRVRADNLRSGQYIASSGGRTLFLTLKKGDTVYLKTAEVGDTIWQMNTCFYFVSKIL